MSVWYLRLRACPLVWLLLSLPLANGQEILSDSVPFKQKGIEIIWTAETNHLKSVLWTYKVAPQNFSEVVISNLLAIGSFTEKDKTNNVGKGPFTDKSVLFYCRKDKNQRLGIYPAQGWIDYYDGTAQAGIRDAPINVPSDDEALQLTKDLLPKLGLSVSEFAIKEGTNELRTHREKGQRKRFDRARGDYVDEVYRRGVFLIRRFDDLDFAGIGQDAGLRVSFGNNGKIIQLELVWRKLERDRAVAVATKPQIVEWIKSGKTFIPAHSAIPGTEVKQIRINKITAFYRGAVGRKHQDACVPFALLEAEANPGGSNPKWHPLMLETPILSSGLLP